MSIGILPRQACRVGDGKRVSLGMRSGMTPARVAAAGSTSILAAGQALLTLVTGMFLHGGVLHLAGNMLYLFIFGAAVEMRFGHERYLYFYLAAGVAGGLAMVFID